MKYRFFHYFSLLLLLLVTGVFWGTWFTITRSIDQFSAAEFIHIGKVIISNVAVPMRIIMPSCIVLMAVSLWLHPRKKQAVFYLHIVGLFLIVIVLLVTLLVLVPIDNQIKTWTADTVPSDWNAIRDRWQTFHTIRTFCSIAAFACFSTFAASKINHGPLAG
jgi:uncharacterized membrane protein